MNPFLRKLLNGYSFTILLVANTLAFLVLLNAALFLAFMVYDRFSLNPVSKKYGHSKLVPLYQDLGEREIDDLLKETWSRPVVYEPFTQFKERTYRGRYVNVSSDGFRLTRNQGPWPPQLTSLNIFLFGGSTTFGYGVADDQTIASYLQENLTARLGGDVRVYNFGRGSYYSTQERILYEQLLTAGFIPDVAIFVDGLNDLRSYDNEPQYSNRLRAFVDDGGSDRKVIDWRFIRETSLGRAAEGVQRRLTALSGGKDYKRQLVEKAEEEIEGKQRDPQVVDAVIRRYLANKKAIEAVSGAFGVRPVFVWQPAPTYKYDERYLRFNEGWNGLKYAYAHVAEFVKREPPGGNFLWCADIQSDARELLYVDNVHYSPKLSRQLAVVIGDLLVEQRSSLHNSNLRR